MVFRQLGTSDLHVPIVSFGAWAVGGWNWGGSDDDAAIRAIRRGIDVGITCIDTAPVYGMGHSETVVGKAIAGRRDQVVVATKCGLRWDREEGEFFFETVVDGKRLRIFKNLKAHSIRQECEESLKRLGIDTIDLYQCHWPDSTTPLDETMEAMLKLQQEGKIRAIGVSNFTPAMMEECLKHVVLASDQPKYNILDRAIESDVLPFCVDHTIGVLIYSPIAQGLLTGNLSPDREFPEGDGRRNNPRYSPENRKRMMEMLEQWRPIAEKHGATFGQLAIHWAVHQRGVTTALVGARTEAQVEENAGAASFTLSQDDMDLMRSAVDAVLNPET